MPLAVPSATHTLISASVCTESFHLYCSSTPTLNIPPSGFIPIEARNSFATFPFDHGNVAPLRAWWSVKTISDSCPVTTLSGNPFGINRAEGFSLRITPSHRTHSSFSRLVLHSEYF